MSTPTPLDESLYLAQRIAYYKEADKNSVSVDVPDQANKNAINVNERAATITSDFVSKNLEGKNRLTYNGKNNAVGNYETTATIKVPRSFLTETKITGKSTASIEVSKTQTGKSATSIDFTSSGSTKGVNTI